MIKRIQRVNPPAGGHWVGDGFPVRTLFSSQKLGEAISPFLMLDYAGPAEFTPAKTPRGVGAHPHKGFETVTIVYQGEVEHRDSTGNAGLIGPGDVQWMTAASGIVHEEKHSRRFTEQGGTLEMVQLWVNLRGADKRAPAGYQTILDADIPHVAIADGRGTVRVIAGEIDGTRGAARTFSPMNVWDVRLQADATARLRVPDGHTASLLVLRGQVDLGSPERLTSAQFVLFDRAGNEVVIHAHEDATLLLLSGEPIDEPVVSYGPFVMNTRAEIAEAMEQFRSGAMGRL